MCARSVRRLIRLLIAGFLLSSCRSAPLPSPTPPPSRTTVPPAATSAPTIPGVILYFPFNGDANDASGHGNNGQVHGAALTADRSGVPNHAYAFDGVDDSITFDASMMPVGTSPRTISAWVNAKSYPPETIPGLGARASVVGWGIDDSRQLSEMQLVNGSLVFHCYSIEPPGNTKLELNRWYHLAIVYSEGTICLYVNGVQDRCDDVPINTSAGSGRIGAFPDAKTHGYDASYFHGILDDVCIFGSALTATQIQELYAGAALPARTIFPVLTPAPPPTATMRQTITVMTYNILDGGGVGPTDPNGEWCCGPPRLGCCGAGGGNRLPRILKVIQAAHPDILGIQEAYLWHLDGDAIAREVAAQLGMNYALGKSELPGGNVALFTRFDIAQAQDYPGHFEATNARGGLHAELHTPDGRTIHVFVVHLKYLASEVSFLIEQMKPYLKDLTLLMGDMNFWDPGSLASMLRNAGWRHPLARQQEIDQIWTSPALESYVQSAAEIPRALTEGTSDHFPVVVTVGIPYP